MGNISGFIKIKAALAAVVLFCAPAFMASCSDDDETMKLPLASTSIAEGAKTVSTLNFTWQPVSGATQYAYELIEKASGNVVVGGITNKTSYYATGLKVNTTYEFSVWSYADVNSSNTTSDRITIEATTNDVEVLKTPANIQGTWDGGIITITWDEVANAEAYAYRYDRNGETISGTTEENSMSILGLPIGDYSFHVRAISTDENYSNSDEASFDFKRERSVIWSTDCSYYSAVLDQVFANKIVAYDDGNFAIEGLYGSDCSLEFVADDNNEIVVLNAYSASAPYYYVAAGDYKLCLYIGAGYSGVECTKSYGYVWYYIYLYDKDNNYIGGNYDEISWGNESPTASIDDLCGTYTETTTCYDLTYDWTNWTEVVDQTAEVTIEKIDDETIVINNFYNWDAPLTAKVDMENRTINIDNTALFADYYYVADAGAQDTPVVGSFDENFTITIRNWSIWYGGYAYIYQDAVSILTKK